MHDDEDFGCLLCKLISEKDLVSIPGKLVTIITC